MRKLSNSGAMSEARRFKTLLLGRAVGGGVSVAMPQATAQNQMIVASAARAWTLLTAPAAEGQVLIAGADPYIPAWGTTFPSYMTFDTGATFGGYILAQAEDAACGFLSYRYSDDTTSPYWSSRKARGDIASPVTVADDDTLWNLVVHGHDGTGWIPAAGIRVLVDGTPGTDDMPGEILLLTTPDGSDALQTRVAIRNTGVVEFYNHVTFNAATSHIRMDTTDGSDTKRLAVCGGGGFADTRGGLIWLGGNEYAGGAGEVSIVAGDIAGGDVKLWTSGALRMKITYAGVFTISTADDTAQALSLADAGGTEYLRIVSTDAQPEVVFNEGGVDVDLRVEASGEASALFVQGSSGFIGVNTSTPANLIHAYATTDTSHTIIIDAQGATSLQRATLDFITLGDGTKGLGDAATLGWHLTARGNAYTTAAQQNDLILNYWDGTTWNYRQYWDHDGNVYIYEDSATVRLSGTFAWTFAISEPIVETFGQIRIPWACTVIRVSSSVIGGTSCSVNVEERATPDGAGTNILSSDMVADVDGEHVISGFNNSSLAEGAYLVYDCSAVSGNVDCVSVTLTVTID